jgi:hypothetical protein
MQKARRTADAIEQTRLCAIAPAREAEIGSQVRSTKPARGTKIRAGPAGLAHAIRKHRYG